MADRKKIKKKTAKELMDQIMKDAPPPPRKKGTTIIRKNGKIYVYSYRNKKK